MHHLQIAVVDLGDAGDVAQLADRQQLLQIILAGVEECQRQRGVGIVAGDDAIGRPHPVRRRRAMLQHGDCDGHDFAGAHLVEFRPRAAVDRARRQMKQEIDDAGRLAAEQFRIELFQLRPDAGQAGERGEQGAEDVGPHGHPCWLVGQREAMRKQSGAVQSKTLTLLAKASI